jgi:hypothetical protein
MGMDATITVNGIKINAYRARKHFDGIVYVDQDLKIEVDIEGGYVFNTAYYKIVDINCKCKPCSCNCGCKCNYFCKCECECDFRCKCEEDNDLECEDVPTYHEEGYIRTKYDSKTEYLTGIVFIILKSIVPEGVDRVRVIVKLDRY